MPMPRFPRITRPGQSHQTPPRIDVDGATGLVVPVFDYYDHDNNRCFVERHRMPQIGYVGLRLDRRMPVDVTAFYDLEGNSASENVRGAGLGLRFGNHFKFDVHHAGDETPRTFAVNYYGRFVLKGLATCHGSAFLEHFQPGQTRS